MTKPPAFPVYVAREPGGTGCGHQHKRREAAWSCAEAIAHIYHRNGHPLPYIDVYEVTKTAEKRVGRVEQKATA